MEGKMGYKSIWFIEIKKLFNVRKRLWSLIAVLILFSLLPSLTLRNFEEKFEFFTWSFLDESVLNFFIYSTAYRLALAFLIVLPWLYHLLFSEERRRFLRKSNRIFVWIINSKFLIYSGFGFILVSVTWISTLMVYLYWAESHDLILESSIWTRLWPPIWHTLIRFLTVYPFMLILFLFLPQKAALIILSITLFFSFFLILKLPYYFHYNLHDPQFNWERTLRTLLAGFFMTIGLISFYRFLSNRTYVFP